VFALLYVTLAWTVGTPGGWLLAIAAAGCHAVQSSLYEGDRTRFHRRAKGIALAAPAVPTGSFLVRLYDSVSTSLDRVGMPLERRIAAAPDPVAFGRGYAADAVQPMRFMALLTANVRVLTIFVACLLGRPQLFWWVEIVPLSVVAIVGILWHRRVERAYGRANTADDRSAQIIV
jgi:hypothetical protein